MLHFEFADAGISPTRWQASTFPEPFRSKITVIHDGIDTEVVKPNPHVKITINNSLVLTKKDEVITFVNRNLEPYRGYHIFMRALPEILKRRPKAYVLIVGGSSVSYGAPPDPKRYGGLKNWKDIFINEVRGKITEDDWKRVFFLGNIPYDHFLAVIQLSSVHVYLTYPFVLSWSLLEAMAVGSAVVASDTAPVKEVIEHEKTGRLVNFFDVKGLVDETCGLLENPEERKRLGENARSFVKENFDLRKVCLPKQIEWVKGLTG
jgi:glycosyltransferase involved in cell wall biosynthesis